MIQWSLQKRTEHQKTGSIQRRNRVDIYHISLKYVFRNRYVNQRELGWDIFTHFDDARVYNIVRLVTLYVSHLRVNINFRKHYN